MMTAAVTTGFFLLMLLVLWVNFDNLNDYQKTTIGIIVGALVGAFNQAVNFWLGSTRQSKDKDNVLASLAMTTTASAANTAAGAAANGGRTFR
jgi:multisubunit Na+/H+ antiporter MnhE subunit